MKDPDIQPEHAGGGYKNVGYRERVITALLGGGLLLRSLRGRSGVIGGVTAVMGMALLNRAASGYCPAYHAMGISTHDRSDTSSLGRPKVLTNRAIKVTHSITIQRSSQDLYRYWRQVENLPQVMSHIRSVVASNEHQSHWIVDTLPHAPEIEWDAEIINEVDDERIGWRTLKGAVVAHAGSVVFEAIGGATTKVTITLQYDSPGGPLGAALASLLGQDPAKKIGEDLARFKEVMEKETIRQ
ncbi:MAG: YgaP-like transmembrane domain [Nitrospirales bacterium]